jgi:hypothetical protein
MLAYLDDILEPSDAQELGEKIKVNKSAGEIVNRIRGSICRVRLPAPKLDGKGMGLDANTVAEYLDNTLPADRVPDFEKVCLESDVHLAEVAASHQILTLVLGEPADVSPGVRDRVYRLAALDLPAAAAAAPPVAGQPAAPPLEQPPVDGNGAGRIVEMHEGPEPGAPVASAEKPDDDEPVTPASRGKPEVPDYLLATRRSSLWPAALMLLLVFAVVFVGLLITWPTIAQYPPVAQLLGRGSDGADAADSADRAPSDNGESPRSNGQGGRPADGVQQGTNRNKPASETAGKGGSGGDGTPASILPAEDVTLPGEEVRPVVPGSTTLPPEPPQVPPEPKDAGAPDTSPAPSETTPATTDTAPPTPVTPMPAPVTPTPADVVPVTPPDSGKPATPPDEATIGTPKPAAEVDVGRFISDEQVLAVEQPGPMWVRLPTLATLVSGHRLLALPTYRPQLALVPGMHITLNGPAVARLGAPLEEGTPMMAIEYGQALLVTAGRADAQIGLQLGGRQGVARFDSAETKLAVDVSHYLPPGMNPEMPPPGVPTSAMPIARIYVIQGRIEWEEEGAPVAAINANQVRLLVADRPGQTVDVKSMPEWISPSAGAADPDRLASRTIEGYLRPETSILLSLNELLGDRRVEVRSLAVRCLGYLDHFEPFIDELTNAQQKSYWDDAFDALQAALARGADTAAQVRGAFEDRRGKDGADLYRMLWGYSPAQLEAGSDVELVTHLENERMDFRVLAFENLRRITGKTLLYRPEYTVRKNQPYVQRWRELAEKKGVVYQTRPTSLPELDGELPMPMPAAESPDGAPGTLPPDAPASPLEVPAPRPAAPTAPSTEPPGRSF